MNEWELTDEEIAELAYNDAVLELEPVAYWPLGALIGDGELERREELEQ